MDINYSVIIPHYNNTEDLIKLIQTIPDRDDIQVIIVDDASYEDESILPDRLSDVVNGRLSKPDIIINKTNQSAGACRNTGLDHARGKWVLFADSDDYYLDGAFDTMDRYSDAGFDLICFAPVCKNYSDDNTDKVHLLCEKYIKDYLAGKSRYESALRYKHYYPWSKMFKRSFLVKKGIRFDKTRYSNDVMFAVKAGYYARAVGASTESIYCYRLLRPDNLSSIQSKEAFMIRFDVFVNKCVFLKRRLTPGEYSKACKTTGWWLVRAFRSGYGTDTVKYMLETYKKYGISIGFSVSDIIDRMHGYI